MTVKILLADDHKIVREGLRSLLEKHHDAIVIAEAPDGRTAVRLTRELSPDVVIIDITMPELNGIEATRQINSENPGVKVIALSMHSDRRFVAEMFKAGACGYLLKDCAFDELASAVNTVTEGKPYVSPGIAGEVIKEFLQCLNVSSPVFTVLTPREREVLQLIAEGKTTGKIASHLNVSKKTVDSHRRQIMSKLDISSLAGLIKFAIREGLASIDK